MGKKQTWNSAMTHFIIYTCKGVFTFSGWSVWRHVEDICVYLCEVIRCTSKNRCILKLNHHSGCAGMTGFSHQSAYQPSHAWFKWKRFAPSTWNSQVGKNIKCRFNTASINTCYKGWYEAWKQTQSVMLNFTTSCCTGLSCSQEEYNESLTAL